MIVVVCQELHLDLQVSSVIFRLAYDDDLKDRSGSQLVAGVS